MPREPEPAVEAVPAQHSDRDFSSIFIGPHGLRAGWAVLLFAGLYFLFREVVGTLFYAAGLIHDAPADSAPAVLVGELVSFISLIAAGLVMVLIEDRRISSYNLADARGVRHTLAGLAAGFVALSVLIAGLAWGGWLRIAPSMMPAAPALRIGAVWAAAFVIVAMVEEGLFRCYALSTLSRGMNFWWALAAQAAICAYVALDPTRHGAMGVYLAAAIGFVPCLVVERKGARQNAAFWQAAWVTSTFFGFYHTLNGGENWIGIFAAAGIGFVCCVSVFVTGSACWAIGCHAAWDWAETYFYGVADSGLAAQGHLFTAGPAGNPLLSGGADGPEGSVFMVGVIVLLLVLLLVVYGRTNLKSFPIYHPAD
ncbi:MAG TPA: CPBP family intramembrane glutamic endopeptidase [Terracidiphilus sp.]|nr:CPBP family intramembrane glutamic endopeptidase [Terracidiphilus sp.]